jgi:hypothetical protein
MMGNVHGDGQAPCTLTKPFVWWCLTPLSTIFFNYIVEHFCRIVNRKQCITSVLFCLAINLNYLPILIDWDFSVICYFLDTWIKPSIALSPLTLLPFNRNNYIMPFYVGMQMITLVIHCFLLTIFLQTNLRVIDAFDINCVINFN